MNGEQYIIAIGASAGGMQQINTFFDFTPLDGVSYIVIQHLSATYKSMMASLLDKHSDLAIIEAENNMLVEPNKVYLIPSKNIMTIRDNRLLLTDKLPRVNYTIDNFFTSLATERKEKAIGIILSGTGSDGTKGMMAIKKEGGLLIASDPAITEYNQMPLSIINTGMVDHIVSPQEMPELIARHVEQHSAGAKGHIATEDDNKTMDAIIELIKDKLPEDFSGYKKNTVLRRIKRRVSMQNLESMEDYYKLLTHDTIELQNLVKDFLISVTSFFRDKEAFEVLEQRIIPRLIEQNSEVIKVWVAGCATGEEAYSIAILIREQLDKAKQKTIVRIFATDIDDDALQVAGKGVYAQTIQGSISPERLKKYFTAQNDGYKVDSSIREMLIFAHHDLVKSPPYCKMDIISCRNVLIYMTPVLQKKVIDLLHFGLKKGGFLLLGPSESVGDIAGCLLEVDRKWKMYENLEAKRKLDFDAFSSPTWRDNKTIETHATSVQASRAQSAEVVIEDMSLLIELGYAGLAVDKSDTVISKFGAVSSFLNQMLFTRYLPDLLPKPLQIAFSAAKAAADKNLILTTVTGIAVAQTNTVTSLFVKPLITDKQGKQSRTVMFREEDINTVGKDRIAFDERLYADRYMVNVEEELKVAKEELATIYDRLHTSNENMHSFNEELLSANEEMQSTNEEMQSVNEELQTINTEYHTKIKELSDLNDDLNNYFRSNLNSQIFVNKDLLLMKFSPSTIGLINLRETDIGRPLNHLSTNIRFETIDGDLREVLEKGTVVTKEIQAINGKWFQVMTMPYLRKGNNETDGAIISFTDITELKEIQQELAKTNRILKVINSDLDNFVYTASHDLLNPVNNIEQLIYFIKEKENVLDSETMEYIAMLSTSVKKFKIVINEMAAIGKLESEMLHVEPVDLMGMITDIKDSISWKIAAEKAVINSDLAVKSILFSKKNCRSMLYNLVNNAIKFRSPLRAPEVTISSRKDGEFTVITVQDNGMGIPENKLESIFEMYNQLTTKSEGQGLGLYLIKKMVDAAGGRVEVESVEGVGTTFRLYLKS